MENKIKHSIDFGDYKEFFENGLLINLNDKKSHREVAVTLSHDGFDSKEINLITGHRELVFFDFSYEIKLLKIDKFSINAEIQVYRKTVSPFSYIENFNSEISGVNDSNDLFNDFEKDELKKKVNTLENQIISLIKSQNEKLDSIEEELVFVKSAFEIIIKQLNSGTKTSWKQTAFSIVTSVACAVAPAYSEQIFTLSDSTMKSIIDSANTLIHKD